jgi:hypothetical protein
MDLYLRPSGQTAGHPGWFSGTSEEPRLLTPDELVDAGYGLRVIDLAPTPGPNQIAVRRPAAAWVIGERTATATYDIVDVPYEYPRLSPRQLRLALLSIGISETQVDAALEGNPAGQIEWKYANDFVRNHPLVVSLAVGFALTPEQVDDLWVYAADI